jgi:cobalt-zinc-cadmium efflux system outer membrane protein
MHMARINERNGKIIFMNQQRLSKCLIVMGLVAIMMLSGQAAESLPGAHVVSTGGDDALSLDRALRLALKHNPDLLASDARKQAAGGRALQARAWPNPELEVFSQDMPVSRSRMSQAKHMAGFSQVVPYPGKKRADIEIGAADAAASTAAWRMHRAELVRDVKITYCQVQTAERCAAVADDLVKVAEAAAAAAGKRNAAGETTRQEQLRAEIQLDQTRAEQTEAAREAAVARQALVVLLGRPDLRDAPLAGAPDESVDLALIRLVPAAWLTGHPAMVAARAQRDQAAASLRRAGLEPLPDIKVGVAGGRDEATEENLMELRFTIPLPLFDRNKGKQQEARAGLREADANSAATEQRLIAEWRASAARYLAASKQVSAHRERILPKSEEALRLVQTGFDEGKFGFIDLLDIQRTTAEARLVYQRKLFELNAARAELEAMTQPVPAR